MHSRKSSFVGLHPSYTARRAVKRLLSVRGSTLTRRTPESGASHDFGGRHGAPRGGGGRRAGRGGGRGQRVSRGLHRPRPRGRGRVRQGERRPPSRAGAGDQARARVRVEAEGWPLQRPPSVMPRARASVQGSFDEGPSTACRLDAPLVPPPEPFGPAPWPELPLRRCPRQDRRVC